MGLSPEAVRGSVPASPVLVLQDPNRLLGHHWPGLHKTLIGLYNPPSGLAKWGDSAFCESALISPP